MLLCRGAAAHCRGAATCRGGSLQGEHGVCYLFKRAGHPEHFRARPQLQHPVPDRLIRDVETALCEEFLDVEIAERDPGIQPGPDPTFMSPDAK